MSGSRRLAVAVLALLGALLFAAYLIRYPLLRHGEFFAGNLSNYHVWYCGFRAVEARRDPYLVEPLRACERAAEPQIARKPWSVTPMPLPGYALALLAPVLALPFAAGKALWLLLSLAALAVSAWCLARVTALPFGPLVVVLAPPLFMLQIMYAGIEAFAIAALAGAALALQRGRPQAAAALAAVALIEPHVGLPAVLGLAVLVPRARVGLAVALALLGALSLLALGWHENLEYLRVVLPAQSASESLVSFYQYSLTHVLYLLGAPAGLAAALGSISYALTIVLGIAVAAQLRDRYRSSAAIVLLPVALSLFGGPYVHNHQIAAALPGALLLATLPLRYAAAAAIAGALLVFPPLYDVRLQEGTAAAGVALAYVLVARAAPSARNSLATLLPGIALAIALIAFTAFDERLPHSTAHQAPQPRLIRADMPASIAWGYLLRWSPGAAVDDLRTVLVKVPWWLALGITTLVATATLAAQERHP